MVIADTTDLRRHAYHCRVEKYRPDTLDDVSGHQDILATINKFVETNVYISLVLIHFLRRLMMA